MDIGSINIHIFLLLSIVTTGCIGLDYPVEEYYENVFDVHLVIENSNMEPRYVYLPCPEICNEPWLALKSEVVEGDGSFEVERLNENDRFSASIINVTLSKEVRLRFYEKVDDYTGNVFSEFTLKRDPVGDSENENMYASYVSSMEPYESINVDMFCKNSFYRHDRIDGEEYFDEERMEINGTLSSHGWSSKIYGNYTHSYSD